MSATVAYISCNESVLSDITLHTEVTHLGRVEISYVVVNKKSVSTISGNLVELELTTICICYIRTRNHKVAGIVNMNTTSHESVRKSNLLSVLTGSCVSCPKFTVCCEVNLVTYSGNTYASCSCTKLGK